MDRKSLKESAKASLKGIQPNPYLLTFGYLIVIIVLEWLSSLNFIISIICNIITITICTGYLWWILTISRNNSNTDEFKFVFTKIVPVVLLSILTAIFVTIGTIIVIIPGIIVALGLTMAPYCLRDNLEAGFWAAIKESWSIMKGHKMDLFVLWLSFIPWFLLTGITCGIVGIYSIPYINTTFAKFYDSIRNN